MNFKKRDIFIVLFFIVTFLSNLISGSYYQQSQPPINEIFEKAVDIFVGFFGSLFGTLLFEEEIWPRHLLFEKILIFFLLLILIFFLLGKILLFEENRPIRGITAFVVSIFGVRYMTETQLETILSNYQIISIILFSILPFLIFFYILHNFFRKSPIIRKVGWSLLIGIYFGLWSTSQHSIQGFIYFLSMIFVFLVLIFDKKIHKYYLKKKINERFHKKKH